jgi:hypothetical protein
MAPARLNGRYWITPEAVARAWPLVRAENGGPLENPRGRRSGTLAESEAPDAFYRSSASSSMRVDWKAGLECMAMLS